MPVGLPPTAKDMQAAFEGNMLSTFQALNALVPALIEQAKGGQILVCSSATAIKPYTCLLYTSPSPRDFKYDRVCRLLREKWWVQPVPV